MTSAFNSTLSWLDSSERERRAVMELVSALNEPGTLDELGIGSIRDTIANALFPGTSTIQTRARYFFIHSVDPADGRRPPRGATGAAGHPVAEATLRRVGCRPTAAMRG